MDTNPNNIASTGKVAIYDSKFGGVDVEDAPAEGIKSADDLLAMAKAAHHAAGIDPAHLTLLAAGSVTDRGAWAVIRDGETGNVIFAHTA